MGLLDRLPATSRKEPDPLEASQLGKVPIDRLAEIAPGCRISRTRVVEAGRIVTAVALRAEWRWAFTSCAVLATTTISSARSRA